MRHLFQVKAIVCLGIMVLAGMLCAGSLPVYQVPVQVQCASPEAAAQAQLSILPLPEGKQVAFSCRWDDSNLRHPVMRKLLHKHGYRATFYLTESGRKGFWEDVMPLLCSDGFTVGNHTRSHLELPLLTPSAIHNEILGWSITLESRTQQPINAFVLPYGQFTSPFFPEVPRLIGDCIRRAGFLGGPDVKPSMLRLCQFPENEYFGTQLILPGDKNTRPEKFDADVARALKNPARPVHLTLGIHTLHSDADFVKLEESLSKYAHRPDWWYCSENEYLAYHYMTLHSRVVDKKVTDSTVLFTLEIPCPELLGSDVPLWAECDGKRFPIPHVRKIPSVIDTAAPNGKCAKFPGIFAKLSQPDKTHFRLELENTGDALENLLVTLRLPPDVQETVLYRQLSSLSGKQTLDWEVTPVSSADAGGRRLTACQIDFTCGGVQGRIWTTIQEQVPSTPKPTPVLQVRYTADAFSEEEQGKFSQAGAELPEKAFVSASQAPNYRNGVYLVRLPKRMTSKDTLLAIMDFQGGRQVRLRGEFPAKMLFNGQPVTPKAKVLSFDTPAGGGRLLLVYPPAKRPPRRLVLLAE